LAIYTTASMVPQPEQWKPAGPSVWHRFRTAKDLL